MSQVLPFYLVCDESGSMKGGSLLAINASLPEIHSEVASNPVVADKTRFCIIGFSGSARMVLPLSDLSTVTDIPMLGYSTGGTHYSALLRRRLAGACRASSGDRRRASGSRSYRRR